MHKLSRALSVLILATFVCHPGAAAVAQDAPPDPVPSDPELQYWRGNIHTHSLWSDGNDFPEMIAEWYRTHDFNFLALSDHNVLSQGQRWMKHDAILGRGGADTVKKYTKRFGPHWVESRGDENTDTHEIRLKPLDEFRALVEERGKFIMIPSEEISDRVGGAPVHMNVTNPKEVISPLGGKTVSAAIEANFRAVEEQARRTGREMIVHLNHPNFGYAIKPADLAMVISERYFEIFNGHPGVNQRGNAESPSVEKFWDIANTIRIVQLEAPPLFGVATDDSHNYHSTKGSTPGRGWIMVRARYLTPERLIRAMKRGDFYGSSGVSLSRIHYDAERRELIVEIDAQPDVTYSTQFIGTLRGEALTAPAKDAKKDAGKGQSLNLANVGKTLATVKGAVAKYRLTGDELYVRAVVTSSRNHSNPSFADQYEQAWTQPVGWEE